MDGGEKWQAVLVLCGGTEGEHAVCTDGQTQCRRCMCLNLLLPRSWVAAHQSLLQHTSLTWAGRGCLWRLPKDTSASRSQPVSAADSRTHPVLPACAGAAWCTFPVTPAVLDVRCVQWYLQGWLHWSG